MKNLYVVCYQYHAEPKIQGLATEKETLDFIKNAKDETVVDNIYTIDCNGSVKTFTPKFNGQFYLEEVVKNG